MRPSPISRRYRRYKMQQAASAAVAEALRRAPQIFGYAKTNRLKVLAKRMAACAASTTIKLQTPKDDATRIIYRNKRSCRSGLCMPCARVRAKDANARIATRLDFIVSQNPQTRYLFLTVTSINRPIAEVCQMFSDHERALARFWRSPDIARAITGQVTGIEIALRGEPGAWEAGVHSHSLVAVHADYFDRKADLYLSQRRIVSLWRHALRADYNPICHVAAVAAGDSVRASLRECVKYAVAPHKLFQRGNGFAVDPVVAVYLADALYKRRLIRFSGVFATTRRFRAAKAMKAKPQQPRKENS